MVGVRDCAWSLGVWLCLKAGWMGCLGILLVKEGARGVLGAGGEREGWGFNQDLCSFTEACWDSQRCDRRPEHPELGSPA